VRPPWNEMTDAQKLWCLMHDAQAAGVHSLDVRRQGVSGNPSARAKDIVSKGHAVWKAPERRGKRPGIRLWLDGWQPDYAEPVLPNGATASEPTEEPYELVRTFDGEWIEQPLAEAA
jgi:hypothetical protein